MLAGHGLRRAMDQLPVQQTAEVGALEGRFLQFPVPPKNLTAYREVMSRIPMVVLNGDPVARYVGNVNLSFAHVEGESLLMVREVDSFRFVS